MPTSTFCLPAHILDAPITPRAREVLTLIASQTSAENPALWICQSTIAKRLRCSTPTVARAIKALLEAKLIAETGQLHEGRYKFYHVRWSLKEDMKAVSKKITKPVWKTASMNPIQTISPPLEKGVGGFEEQPQRKNPPDPLFQRGNLPPAALPPTISPQAILKDSRIAYFAEIARQRHQENRKLHESILLQLR